MSKNVIQIHKTITHMPPPAKCFYCGTQGGREFFVDTGGEAEWEGVILMCNSCLENIMKQVYGFDLLRRIKVLNDQIEESMQKYETDLAAYHTLLRALERVHIQLETIFAMAEMEDQSGSGSSNDESPSNDIRDEGRTEKNSDVDTGSSGGNIVELTLDDGETSGDSSSTGQFDFISGGKSKSRSKSPARDFDPAS